MPLELHVWGPAFTLPSIDPECLAAAAYLARAVPRGRWVLMAGVEGGASDARRLPALHDDAEVVCGFRDIVAYLRTVSHGHWDLDAALTPVQRADCVAFSTFLGAHALPLLDLSLYVSSQNYATTTRPAYASLLAFPSSWVIPTQRRAAAKQRSAHLGLSALDLSTSAAAETASEPSAKASLSIPESLRKASASVSAAIKSPETASRIRLAVLTEKVLDPLAALLGEVSNASAVGGGEDSYLLSSHGPSSLDCLALGYLALFLVPAVPHAFLATTLKEKYPRLVGYVRRGIQQCYCGIVKVEDARPGLKGPRVMKKHEDEDVDLSPYNNMANGSKAAPLPWLDAPPPSPLQNIGTVLREAADGIPGLGPLLKPDPLQHAASTADSSAPNTASLTAPPPLLSTLLAVGTGVVAIGGAVLYTAGFGLGGAEDGRHKGTAQKTRLADMGEAGEVLAMGSFGRLDSSQQ
ncbi:hypothetical protein MMC26_006520 [Xylographa opegraphella]|nr:hypothetical protein [Xylographa opegraphella]